MLSKKLYEKGDFFTDLGTTFHMTWKSDSGEMTFLEDGELVDELLVLQRLFSLWLSE